MEAALATRTQVNPYADAEGVPLDGHFLDFLTWAADQEEDRLDSLKSEERTREQEAQAALLSRMEES